MDRSPAVILAKRKREAGKMRTCVLNLRKHTQPPPKQAALPHSHPELQLVPANTPWGRDLAGTEPAAAKVVFCSLSVL